MTSYDVARVRDRYPALAEGLVLLDGPGGTQVAEPVAAAVADTMRTAISNQHGPFVSSQRADAIVDAARAAVADLVGGQARGVVLGPNTTTLMFRLAAALSAAWQPGDEIVVSRLDHDANVRPWVLAAKRAGATVRWADIDMATCELPVDQYDDLLTTRTRLVALTGASNAVGTRPDVRAVADRAHAKGALVAVDGVHLTPHAAVDVGALGADFYALSSYKFGGPHLGALVADPALLATLSPAKLVPAPEEVPGRFETGTPPFAQYAGLTATVDHLAALLPQAGGTRRARLAASMAAVESYEAVLLRRLLEGLGGVPGVRCLGAARRRTPTVSFLVEGWEPAAISAALAARGIAVWSGDYYAYELMVRLGLPAGAVRVGAVHYTTEAEVDTFLGALADVTARS